MYKKSINILFGLILVFSLFQLTIYLEFFNFPDIILKHGVVAYIVIVLISSLITFRLFQKLKNAKPKEEVKIIYKNFDKNEAGPDIVEKKEIDKIDKIANSILKELGQETSHEQFTEKLLVNFAKSFEIVQGIIYIKDKEKDVYSTSGTYAFYQSEADKKFEIGEGITGQVAKDKKFLYIDNVPDDYITVLSGLGQSNPRYLSFLPIIKDDKTIAIIEFASFVELPKPTEKIFESLSKKLTPYFEKYIKTT